MQSLVFCYTGEICYVYLVSDLAKVNTKKKLSEIVVPNGSIGKAPDYQSSARRFVSRSSVKFKSAVFGVHCYGCARWGRRNVPLIRETIEQATYQDFRVIFANFRL